MKTTCKNILALTLAFLMVVLFVPRNVLAELANLQRKRIS